MAEKYKPVTFLNSRGETISNDPVFRAQQIMAGVKVDDSNEDITTEQVDENGKRTYGELDAKELKALASERGVDISGLKKVGEVRKALIDADAKSSSDAAGETNTGAEPTGTPGSAE